MKKEQEAQQAQTIGQIRGKLNRAIGKFSDLLSVEMLSDIEKLLEIVDSRAQKIAEQKAELNVTTTMLNDMNELCAEQAKEIERLKNGGLVKPGSYRKLIRNLRNAKP